MFAFFSARDFLSRGEKLKYREIIGVQISLRESNRSTSGVLLFSRVKSLLPRAIVETQNSVYPRYFYRKDSDTGALQKYIYISL